MKYTSKMRTRSIYFIVLLSGLLAVLARLKFNGLVYGFDYGLYHPDGIDYTYKTLELMGGDSTSVSKQISDWYSDNSLKMTGLTPKEVVQSQLSFPHSRILFPLLSVPFVKLFGIPGMLAVPILSFLTLQISILILGQKFNRIEVAAFLALTMSTSPTLLRWMVNDCADALFVALVSQVPFILSLKNRNFQRIILLLVVIFSSFTRFSLLVFLAIGLVLFIKRNLLTGFLIIISSVILSIPALTQTNSMLLPQSQLSIWEKLSLMPYSALRVGFVEIAQLAALDRILLFIVMISFFLAVKNFRAESSMYFLGVLMSVWAMGALNGALGVNFRYQLPLLIFCCWVIFESSPRFIVHSRTHVISKEI